MGHPDMVRWRLASERGANRADYLMDNHRDDTHVFGKQKSHACGMVYRHGVAGAGGGKIDDGGYV